MRGNSIRGNVAKTSNAINYLIAEILDGATVTFTNPGEEPLFTSFMDFVKGKREDFPIKIRIDVKE